VALPTQDEIASVARDVLRELTGTPRGEGSVSRPGFTQRPFVDEGTVRAAKAAGRSVINLPKGAVITPLARDVAGDLGVELRIDEASTLPAGTPAATSGVPAATSNAPAISAAPADAAPADAGPAPQEGGAIALGADHGGFPLKEALKKHLQARGLRVLDQGTTSTEAVDYPDFAAKVAKAVALSDAAWGVLVDGAGIGSCMAANKVPGVLAATCHDERTAKNSREHNGANVLCLGSGSLDEAAAKRVLDAWLATGFAGGRHGKRVAKIRAIERSFTK
jgi:ribose 5-phosphate isomerase B